MNATKPKLGHSSKNSKAACNTRRQRREKTGINVAPRQKKVGHVENSPLELKLATSHPPVREYAYVRRILES